MIKSLLEPLSYWRKLGLGILDGVDFMASGEALETLRPAWIAFEGALLVVGLIFWVALMFGVSAFDPDTWGAWACQFPALMWAGIQITASVMIIYGLMRPITYQVAAAGALIHALQYEVLAMSAIFSGGQVVIGIYPSVLFAPAHIVLAVEAWRYGRKR